MSILYDEGQEAIAGESRRIAEARSDKARLLGLIEQTGAYDDTFWQTAIEQGWTGLAIPEEFGGLGLSLVELGIVAQACGGPIAGAPFLTTNDGAAHALLGGENDALKAQWLPRLASGEVIAAVAFAEGQAPLPPRPIARLTTAGLAGEKPGVTAAAHAQIAIVWALEEGEPALVLCELGAVSRNAISGFDAKVRLIDSVAPSGSLFVFPTANFTQADAQTRERLALAKREGRYDWMAIGHLNEASDLFVVPRVRTCKSA